MLHDLERMIPIHTSSSLYIHVTVQVESAIGLLNLRAICEVDRSDMTSSSIFRHEGLILGGDDFASSIGKEEMITFLLRPFAWCV